MAFWYNVATKLVETDDNRSQSVDLLGPFATRNEAERAFESAHARTEKLDAEDKAWEGDDE